MKKPVLPDQLTTKETPDLVYCSLPRRLLAMLYESIILFGLLVLGSAIALPFGDVNKVAFHDFWFTAWLFLLCFLYFAICWRRGGITVGMRAWKISLVSQSGQSITWLQCLVRYSVSLVSLALLGLGFAWALLDSKNRTWHDLAAGTILVKSPWAKTQSSGNNG